MSQENMELVKALIPQGTDIVPLFKGETASAQALEALGPFFADDFQSVIVLPAQSRTVAGLEGFRENWLDWLEPWGAYRITIDDLIDLGERVIVLTRNYGRRKDMEAEVELIAAAIVTVKEGKVSRWEDYADRAAALEAAGLSE